MHRKALQSPARQTAGKFSWRLAIKEFFLIVVLAFLVGVPSINAGYRNVYNLAGGKLVWLRAGQKLIKE
ncbi:MAG: hypothetical protein ACUVSK_04055 [Desulfotomaculales bacterium]